ncbi:MAG TPA: membrane protein insertase YidC [Vicinamibacterales bacterium]|nr:membrane protein insertase YidC [Vicinamibacterales bacterium]
MERRVLIAITLSFLVLFLFQRFVMPPPAPIPGNVSASATGATGAADAAQVAPAAQGAPGAQVAPAAPVAPAIAATVSEAAAREIVVETSKVRAVFSNRGAKILHWVLKEYRDDRGEPLDLVPSSAGANAMKPFTLTVDDQATSARINDAIYRVTVDGAPAGEKVDATASPKSIVFETASADGLSVKKTFSVEPTSYIVGFSPIVMMGSQRLNPIIHWGPGLGDDIARSPPASFFSPSYNTPAQAIVHKDGSVERISPEQSGSQDGAFRYAGVDDHYFVSMLLNEQNTQNFRIEYAPAFVPQPDVPDLVGKYVGYSIRFQQPTDQARFFFGPKAFDDLKSIDAEATRVINFGIFSWLAVPLLGALKWVHGYIGNWGWAIIVLTIFINAAMFPLRHKSVVSMKKMQKIQPQMKAIQDRYAKYKITDPERQKMNTEVMALYKAEGVNPASGCIPTLLTFPFLFGFYNMLSQSIEIRGADFALWINNLSGPDPYYVLPVVFGAIQVYQMKITPMGGDPAQQKVMMFMPIMFTLMSLSFPSGLVLYWLVSTVLTILQQQLTTRITGAPVKTAAK